MRQDISSQLFLKKSDSFQSYINGNQLTKTMKRKVDDKNGLISFILGLSSLVVPFAGIILAFLAVYFYGKQRKVAKTKLATTGLVLAVISILIYFVFPILAVIGTYVKMGFSKLI